MKETEHPTDPRRVSFTVPLGHVDVSVFHWRSTMPKTSSFRAAGLSGNSTIVFGVCLPRGVGATNLDLLRLFNVQMTDADSLESLKQYSGGTSIFFDRVNDIVYVKFQEHGVFRTSFRNGIRSSNQLLRILNRCALPPITASAWAA